MELRVDAMFADLLQPLADDELVQLEASILAEGCRDPLVAWGATDPPTLLDGHNRLNICQKHGIAYRVNVIDLSDEKAARKWVVTNQLAKRNLTPEQSSYLRGLIYNEEKRCHGGDRSSNQNDYLKTKDRLARELGVGSATIQRDGKFADAVGELVVSLLDNFDDKTIRRLSLGPDKKLRRQETVKLAKEEPEHKLRVAELILSGQANSYKEARKVIDQEAFDREAERFRDLSLDDCVDPSTWGAESMQELLSRASSGGVLLDAIITDPPYPEEYLPLYGEMARLAKNCLHPEHGVLAVMCGQSYLPRLIADMAAHLPYRWTLAYLTPGGQAVQLWDRNVNTFWKPILLFGAKGCWIGDVVKSKVNDNDKRFHGWGQSESGMANLVEALTSPGQLVCDPFMGAGTTGVVCVTLARRFVGCDVNPDHVEMAKKRMQVAKGRSVPNHGAGIDA